MNEYDPNQVTGHAIERLACSVGHHLGWHEVLREPADPLGIVDLVETCRCGKVVRKLWIDSVSGRVLRVFREPDL